MSEHNKQLVRRALEEIYAKGNFELANELVHPDFVDHEPAHPEQPTGPESVEQTARRLQSAFGGLRFEVEDEPSRAARAPSGRQRARSRLAPGSSRKPGRSRAARRTLPHKPVQRAKLVLHAAQGSTNVEIGARLDINLQVVGRWRRRFCEERLE
jgi:SnoaL-like polyketide cyclase/Homeodomain-like domain